MTTTIADLTTALSEYTARRAVRILRQYSRTGEVVRATVAGRTLTAWYGMVR